MVVFRAMLAALEAERGRHLSTPDHVPHRSFDDSRAPTLTKALSLVERAVVPKIRSSPMFQGKPKQLLFAYATALTRVMLYNVIIYDFEYTYICVFNEY